MQIINGELFQFVWSKTTSANSLQKATNKITVSGDNRNKVKLGTVKREGLKYTKNVNNRIDG